MVIADPYNGGVSGRTYLYCDVKDMPGFYMFNADGRCSKILQDLFSLFWCHIGNDFQLFFRFACGSTRSSGKLESFSVAGVGHYNAFDVFDDASAHLDQDLLRQRAEGLPRQCCCIGKSNRLCAAHCGDQFLI